MKKRKKAQLNISFGMIFSIILIVIFIVFAFYAIKFFLNLGNDVTIGTFVSDFQNDINRAWKDTEIADIKNYNLPSKVKSICFVDFSSSSRGKDGNLFSELRFEYFQGENMILYPLKSSKNGGHTMNNIDVFKITTNHNPYCIEVVKGKVEIILLKEMGESLVRIE